MIESGRLHNDASELERILIVENSLRVGIAQGIARIFGEEDLPKE